MPFDGHGVANGIKCDDRERASVQCGGRAKKWLVCWRGLPRGPRRRIGRKRAVSAVPSTKRLADKARRHAGRRENRIHANAQKKQSNGNRGCGTRVDGETYHAAHNAILVALPCAPEGKAPSLARQIRHVLLSAHLLLEVHLVVFFCGAVPLEPPV